MSKPRIIKMDHAVEHGYVEVVGLLVIEFKANVEVNTIWTVCLN